MEIELASGWNGELGIFSDNKRIVDYVRKLWRERTVGRNHFVVERTSFLAMGIEHYGLGMSVLESEDDLIRDMLKHISGRVGSSDFGKDEDTVFTENFHIRDGISEHAIHIDSEPFTSARLQGNISQSHALVVTVIDNESLSGRGYIVEQRVELDCVNAKLELGIGRCCELFFFGAGEEEKAYQRSKYVCGKQSIHIIKDGLYY